ncbi:hypothetical protein EW026_g6095 [Hermanssonia centrifuga]|uniref:Ams2/SPT21 N-terminal domain-containing protein n=1 Tax=Hermanssonia centrifuga TaxID=98765 RepID=A0A4S4KC25_9APHY|nr:hypothetical protein EW026_g6095 [Hermanssonia centrifuga]
MERRELGIRVLYTINSNTQYILALPTRKHSISILSLAPSHPHPHPPIVYGRAALKSCLDEVFCSSPELIPDGKRDFSIYALDPLEACSAMHLSGPSSAHSQPGVAIGLGLMSWTLADPECDIAVTGTVVNDPVRGEAFETVFAFRETPYRTAITENIASSQCEQSPKIAIFAILAVSHHSPSPVRRASEAAGPLVPNAETTSTIKSLVDMLAGADKNPEILATLASIDATANGQKPSTNLMLIEALSKLLYPALAAPELPSNTRQAVSATLTGAPLSRSSSSRQPSRATREGSDDEIVVLDKENINPSAFKRRRSEKDALFDPPSSSADPEPLSSVLAVNTNTARASTNRKRTLSDFMDERDRERERTPQDSAVDDLFGSPLFTPVGKRRSPVSGSTKKPLNLHKSPFFSPAKRYPVRHPVSPLRRKSHPLALADDADDDGASPSSSLPVASDSEDDAAPRSPPRPVEPHWSIDLPPSSPPPPSSPMLSPCRDELVQEEDLTARLPAPPTVSPRRRMAPHDADPFAFFAGTDPETESSADATLALEGFESVFTSDGFLAAAPIVPQSGISSSTDLVDFFSEPTMVGTEGDALATDGSPEDFSFEQFWDSMKGLLDQSATEGWQQNPDETVDPSLLSRPVDVAVDVTVDTVRLAHDVQTLYSGCLL